MNCPRRCGQMELDILRRVSFAAHFVDLMARDTPQYYDSVCRNNPVC